MKLDRAWNNALSSGAFTLLLFETTLSSQRLITMWDGFRYMKLATRRSVNKRSVNSPLIQILKLLTCTKIGYQKPDVACKR
jgi:hypothetical protein